VSRTTPQRQAAAEAMPLPLVVLKYGAVRMGGTIGEKYAEGVFLREPGSSADYYQ